MPSVHGRSHLAAAADAAQRSVRLEEDGSATLGIYLLHVVGLGSDGLAKNGTWATGILGAAGIRHMIDLLVTGLAIGGGTKPLHDLISNLQAAKLSKKDPSQIQ